MQNAFISEEVNCGGHLTSSCAKCPQGNGASWCNGECEWSSENGGVCQSKKLILPVSKEEVEIEEESDYLNVSAEPTLLEMKQSRSCDIIFSSQRPLYSKDDWQYLRDLWSSQQEGTKQLKLVKTKKKKKTNFISPIQSGQTIDGKGRGLFATRDIKKGEMIFNGELQLDNLIKFTDGQSYRKFVYAIEDDGMACDVMLWTYPGRNDLIFQADESSLMNDVRLCVIKCIS